MPASLSSSNAVWRGFASTAWMRAGQRVVEHVAAGAGDDQHAIVRRQVQRRSVDGRILPAGVVDKRAAIDRIEQLLVDPVENGRSRRQGCLSYPGGNSSQKIDAV